jgi:ATP-dependent RNA helicase DDX10/DBP4
LFLKCSNYCFESQRVRDLHENIYFILFIFLSFYLLGAAKTGSGKTLAFLIPLIEKLFCLKWTATDGLGALVITPTRELAYQIFETLRKIGKYHDFSAGLVIGGKDLKFESSRLSTCNIVICTPGRILQHMDENPNFDPTSMKLLVLDEADRCLDMGFSSTMNAILVSVKNSWN